MTNNHSYTPKEIPSNNDSDFTNVVKFPLRHSNETDLDQESVPVDEFPLIA